jgi:hypothetical protein
VSDGLNESYDVLVIGGGPAGQPPAVVDHRKQNSLPSGSAITTWK